MFTSSRISRPVCDIHVVLCLMVFNSSDVGIVTNFCIFHMYVSCSMKKSVLVS